MFTHFFSGLVYLWKDKWTLLSRVVVPLLLSVLILSSTLGFISKGVNSNQKETPLIAVSGADEGKGLIAALQKRKDLRFTTDLDSQTVKLAATIDTVNLGMAIGPGFDQMTTNGQTGNVRLYYNSGSDFVALARIRSVLKEYENNLLKSRLSSVNFELNYVRPVKLEEMDSYSPFSFAIQNIAGFVTLFMVFFGMLAAIYASLDFATNLYGKKLGAYLGRLLSIVVIGTLFSYLSYLVLKWGLYWNPAISQLLVNSFEAIITKTRLARIMVLLLPCMFFFATFFTWVGLAGKSFKRAQNTLQPIKLMALFLLIWAILPSCLLLWKTAFVPVLNSAVSIREIFSGNPYSKLMWVSVAILIGYSLIAMFLSRRYIVES